MSDTREAFKFASRKYAAYGPMFDRAVTTVLSGGVKEHRFNPSGRVIRTVVGSQGDELVDPDRPYCSCSDFFFRVTNGKARLCYHLMSYMMAVERGKVNVIQLHDDEYGQFYSMLVKDVFKILDKSDASLLRLP